MAGRKLLKARAVRSKRLHLAGKPDSTILAPANVQRNDAEVVARSKVCLLPAIVDDKGEHAAQIVEEDLWRLVHVEGEQHLAVRARERGVRRSQLRVELLVNRKAQSMRKKKRDSERGCPFFSLH